MYKYVLVNWSGEGAPTQRKGQCAGHVRDVAGFLRGAHVTINGRNDTDLDADSILKLVRRANSQT